MVAALATLAGSGLTPASAAGQMQAEVPILLWRWRSTSASASR